MINAFKLNKKKLLKLTSIKYDFLKKSLWIDLIKPSNKEREKINITLGQKLTTSFELENIESSARFFEDSEGLHIHSLFFYSDSSVHFGNSTVAFTISKNILYTLRERELPTFSIYQLKNESLIDGNAYEIFLNIFEIKIEQLADKIENLYNSLESLSIFIMNGTNTQENYNKALSKLSVLEDISWKVRLCLVDTQRAIKFIIRKSKLPTSYHKLSKEILRDVESLLSHNESLLQKFNFLMQSAMGFINIEQSRIIKIFSVVSVIFLPPTLIASSYGMNFKFIPELNWILGYPFAIILMIFTGLLPYLYFKIKKWL
ncbi:magnesium/cobalt transporter CorA [Sodalis-like secondary symbiont of Drepanosiphum platanoidis]|uniref:magnesium/cobalt transporter CorA n=1 Tax=Sodalis-like secondary symbiont of Drepanosiphum platanoidis TaxID=2994493 RepID=UPI00346417B6